MAEISTKLEDFKSATDYYQKAKFYKDSLAASKAQFLLRQYEVEREESLKRESELLAERERIKQRNRLILALVGSGILVLVAIGLFSRLNFIRKSKQRLQVEKDRSESLLLNILPEEIANELKEKGKADARDFDMVSILFTDFAGFTEQSAKLSASDLVSEINQCFEAFDHIIEKYGIEKIKTIGDAYMAAGGLPIPDEDSVKNTVLAALEMQEFIEERRKTKDNRLEPAFRMRVGIHTGPVVAGIVGVKKFQYDIWGDTVNTASRVESAGEVGKVNISQATYELLSVPSTSSGSDEGSVSDPTEFSFESRGKVEVKGKGEIGMYFVKRNKE